MWCGRISGCDVNGSVGVVWTDGQWVWCGRMVSGCGVNGWSVGVVWTDGQWVWCERMVSGCGVDG